MAPEPIKGADAALWEAHKPEQRCACGTVAYYSDGDKAYCPVCWRIAGYPAERKPT